MCSPGVGTFLLQWDLACGGQWSTATTNENVVRIFLTLINADQLQSWYLFAWCLLRQDFRLFKLVRIKNIRLTDRVYQSREIPTAEQGYFENQWQETAKLVELDLLFDKNMENVVEECFGEEIMRQNDGKIMVKACLPENNWLYGYLLSFGSGMEVVKPPHIRSILAAIAEKIYKTYSS